MKPLFTSCWLLTGMSVFLATGVAARDVSMPERFNVGGFPDVVKTKPYVLTPHSTPRLLPKSNSDSASNRQAAKAARAYMDAHPATTGMLLIENGEIAFEAYQGQGSERSEFYSQSIAKSVTSLAIGKAVCSGVLPGLNIRAEEIAPELSANNLGKSTIGELLMMSSGAYMTRLAGQPQFEGGIGRRLRNGKPFFGTPWPTRLGQVTHDELLWGSAWNKIKFKNERPPGESFVYKALDTQTLGKMIERVTGNSLAAYFDRTIWKEIKAAGRGRWEADITGSTVAYSGLQLRLRDWGRLAVWILEQRQRTGCFGDYLRDATTKQIANTRLGSGAGSSFNGYGYQWWTDNPATPGFWGKGYAGQELALHPETGKILIKFGYKAYKGTTQGINQLFRDWNRN